MLKTVEIPFWTPRVDLSPVNGASLALAKEQAEVGRWKEAARTYHSVFVSTRDPKTLILAYSGSAEHLINYGAYDQLDTFLERGRQRVDVVSDERIRAIGLAVYFEKNGWKNDNLCNPQTAIKNFQRARNQLGGIRRVSFQLDELDELAEGILHTSTHFIARNKTSTQPEESIQGFNQELERLNTLREQGSYEPANIGFQHAHIALAYLNLAKTFEQRGNLNMVVNQQNISLNHIGLAVAFFEDYQKDHPQSSITAHSEMILGQYELAAGSPNQAREHFLKALSIREMGLKTGVEPFTKGYADAALGVAYVNFMAGREKLRPGEFINTLVYLLQALKVNPRYTLSRIRAGIPI